MPWPAASPAEIASFQARGWLALPEAVPPAVVDDLAARCEAVHTRPGLAMEGLGRGPEDLPGDRVLQSMLEMVWLDWKTAPFHAWTRNFASALMGQPVTLWYNQLLDKPPRVGAATWWHQDGASLGPGVGDRLVSCWMALDAVDETSGCMHFQDHRPEDGLLMHEPLSAEDCGRGACEIDPARVVAVPLPKGGLTFHRGMTPHMARANRSERWRQVLIQRFVWGATP